MSSQISEIEQEQLIEKLEIFKIHGRDKRGRKILRIIGKFFPGNLYQSDLRFFFLYVDFIWFLWNLILNFSQISSISVTGCVKEVSRGEGLSSIREKTIRRTLRPHRRTKEREFPRNLSSTSDLRRDSCKRQRQSPGGLLPSSRSSITSLPRYLWPISILRRVSN